MTSVNDVKDDPRFTPCLDHGFVGLIDHMGSDSDIARAARLSYGKGTRSVSEDRGLIRYLIRHQHWSPIEMAEVKLHLKLPIFVMRQLVRHRTSSLNEMSARYSVIEDECYVPEEAVLQPQSASNKQGRAGVLSGEQIQFAQDAYSSATKNSFAAYQTLLGGDEFPGIAREIARCVLPVGTYTELYWKQDLRNLLAMLKLRRDGHAQYEIRVFAEAIFQAIKPLFPITCEAWEDYVWESANVSRMEVVLLRKFVALWRSGNNPEDAFAYGRDELGMSEREIKDFAAMWLD